MNQMVPQGHYMGGMNPMQQQQHSGSLSTSGAPPSGGGFPNMQGGPPNSSGGQMYPPPQGSPAFNRPPPQGAQMPMMPGIFNPFQQQVIITYIP